MKNGADFTFLYAYPADRTAVIRSDDIGKQSELYGRIFPIGFRPFYGRLKPVGQVRLDFSRFTAVHFRSEVSDRNPTVNMSEVYGRTYPIVLRSEYGRKYTDSK